MFGVANIRSRFDGWPIQSALIHKEKFVSKNSGFKPGQKAPASGQYQIVGPRGGKGPERTVVRNEPLPPTPNPGSSYTLVDRTKHK